MSDFETIVRNPKELGDGLLDLKNRKKFCDAEIIVDTERIAVHKNVLASSSAYFERLFSDESTTKVQMEFMNLETVKSILEYCYTGIIKVSEKNLEEILQFANFLKMNPIIEGCKKILEKKMDSSNCISSWKLAQSENFENLKNIAFEYARQNYEKVSQSPAFLDLNDSEISELLSSDIIVTNETIVFNSVKKWINHDSTSRKQHLDTFLKYIRFEYLPGNILSSSEFKSFCSDNSSSQCLIQIIDAQRRKIDEKSKPSDGNIRESYTTLAVVGSHFYNKPKSMELFDLRNEKWTKIENFEFNKGVFSAVLLEHKLMLIGGRTETDPVNTVQSYDLKTGVMENLPSMKYKRERSSAVEFEGRVYVIGGLDKTQLANVEMWDPLLRLWKELSPMTIARNSCEAVILNQEIFIVGGFNGNHLSDIESYNPITDKWRKRASMNEKRSAAGVIVFNGYVYAVGGKSDGFLITAERFDPKIEKWTMIHSLKTSNCWMGAAKLMGKFVIIGGSPSEDEYLSSVEMYDDENDNWISMPSINEPRRMLRAIEIPWPLAKFVLSREVSK